MEDQRIVSSCAQRMEEPLEQSLRPRVLSEYIGQEKVKDKMKIFIEAALKRAQPLDHVLLYGPPGLGKTTLARIIAAELGVNIRTTSGPALGKPGDLAGILSNLAEGDVLFIDEIHRMNASVEEVMYPAMEDFALDIMLGNGPAARSMRIDLRHFTLVGATTRAGMLTSPLRDRFGIINRLELYSPEELSFIVNRSARLMNIRIEPSGALEIARRSRGTPRIANRLLSRVRDYAEVRADGVITDDVADAGLRLMEVDELGLDLVDRRLLEAIIKRFGGGPVGLENLASSTGEEVGTIEDVYEPYLLQLGFLKRTPRGRVAMPAAYEHLGIKITKENAHPTLFDSADI